MSELSKAVAFSVLGAPEALNMSKAVAYAVLDAAGFIVVSKAVVYAVLEEEGEEAEGGVQPFVFIL